MSDKLWRAVYDRFHKPQTDPEKKKENVERYHAMVKMMVAIERQNLLQIAEDKNFLNSDADLDSFIDGLETALIISMLVEDDTNEFMRPVCRRVATDRKGRETTHAERNGQRDHSTADTSGAGRTNIASNHRKARVGNAGS